MEARSSTVLTGKTARTQRTDYDISFTTLEYQRYCIAHANRHDRTVTSAARERATSKQLK